MIYERVHSSLKRLPLSASAPIAIYNNSSSRPAIWRLKWKLTEWSITSQTKPKKKNITPINLVNLPPSPAAASPFTQISLGVCTIYSETANTQFTNRIEPTLKDGFLLVGFDSRERRDAIMWYIASRITQQRMRKLRDRDDENFFFIYFMSFFHFSAGFLLARLSRYLASRARQNNVDRFDNRNLFWL